MLKGPLSKSLAGNPFKKKIDRSSFKQCFFIANSCFILLSFKMLDCQAGQATARALVLNESNVFKPLPIEDRKNLSKYNKETYFVFVR